MFKLDFTEVGNSDDLWREIREISDVNLEHIYYLENVTFEVPDECKIENLSLGFEELNSQNQVTPIDLALAPPNIVEVIKELLKAHTWQYHIDWTLWRREFRLLHVQDCDRTGYVVVRLHRQWDIQEQINQQKQHRLRSESILRNELLKAKENDLGSGQN